MVHLHDLFPTPVMHVTKAVPSDLAAALRERFISQAEITNARSSSLSHSGILSPHQDVQLQSLVTQLMPHIVEFGTHLFGETLAWAVKELWANVLQTGASQSLHNHANCFVSGVVYPSPVDASSQTVFVRGMGAREFTFRNTHAGSTVGPYNADKWIAPAPQVGDLILFPSYLLHEVPTNQGAVRISLSFNAIPQRLDAWGYGISMQA
jgi:uncharacterized protein (TIGR02466 family)